MELITPLSENNVPQKSYELFHVIMQAHFSHPFQGKKWKASHLSLHCAYKQDTSLPYVEDPQDILVFLDYHFNLATKGNQTQDDQIQDALCALAYASNCVTIEALNNTDLTKPPFVCGICYIYQDSKPLPLRKAALSFLSLISGTWFNTTYPIMEPDQMKRFCLDWVSAVGIFEHTYEVQKATLTILFEMINSPHWHPHIITEKQKLLEYLSHTRLSNDEKLLKLHLPSRCQAQM